MSEELKVNANYSASSFLAAAKNKIEESSFFWGDLMREATRLSRISFYFFDLSQEETCCVLIPTATIISYLIAFERLFLILRNDYFRTKQTKKEPACSVAEQAGVREIGLSGY